jgi:hypothetical protein
MLFLPGTTNKKTFTEKDFQIENPSIIGQKEGNHYICIDQHKTNSN